MSWDLLRRFIESDHFNSNPFLSVAYLSRYANHVGIQHVLSTKLRQFSYEEIEFFLPQLCHLVVSLDIESMALEEFILDLCEDSVSGALLTFWLFQTYLHDLSSKPQSVAFKTCRRVYNKVQTIVFGGQRPQREKLKENILPVTALASFVLTAVAAPFFPAYAGPLAIAQARKPRYDETISDSSQTQRMPRSNTVASGSVRNRRVRNNPAEGDLPRLITSRPSDTNVRASSASATPVDTLPSSSRTDRIPSRGKSPRSDHRQFLTESHLLRPRHSSSSLPDVAPIRVASAPPSPRKRPSESDSRRHSRLNRSTTMSRKQKIAVLRSNYFRSETQFLTALQDISNRLVTVPKAARLSALRAELGLIAQDLPAEVDIPIICPASLPDGSPALSSHHRIVRLNPAEATVLNSAERVPYLLMVEVLRNDFDFDPESAKNVGLLAKIASDEGSSKRRIFDITDAPRPETNRSSGEKGPDSVFEPVTGDLGSPALIRTLDENTSLRPGSSSNVLSAASLLPSQLASNSAVPTPRSSKVSSDSSTSLRNSGTSRAPIAEQPDISALATHMRTAAAMLSQLDSSQGKRPKDEVAAIKAKIIASMQTLEEQSFNVDGPTFDSIMANTAPGAVAVNADNFDDSSLPDPELTSGAGAARMENDQKTGGVERRGDRDDPSAATFGEQWDAKKERIQKSSPYGWMKNWDLLSVIVKTGADLRQEAFACQLISTCGKIWEDAHVPVYVRRMRILVTGESSGLIETITNGVSLHSIKRSLTLATIAAGTNPRGRIATLKDHFIKSFGEPDSSTYKAAETAFARSLAAYSIISYILQLKDRHNGNILIDEHGNIIHIDFGFMLSNSPGSVGFEAAPFKLTQDYIDVLGGVESASFGEFKNLCKQAFQALRKSAESIVSLVEIQGKDSKMPCFSGGAAQATAMLRQRFQLQLSADDAEKFVDTDLIGKSLGSYYTRLYDTFQYRSQGIY